MYQMKGSYVPQILLDCLMYIRRNVNLVLKLFQDIDTLYLSLINQVF